VRGEYLNQPLPIKMSNTRDSDTRGSARANGLKRMMMTYHERDPCAPLTLRLSVTMAANTP
jgi:hypothetical protein